MDPVTPAPATPTQVRSLLFELRSGAGKEWHHEVAAAAAACGLNADRRAGALLVWDSKANRPVRPDIQLAAGWQVRKEWVGPRQHALGVLPHLLFFENGESAPSHRPQYELFGSPLPDPRPIPTRLASCLELAERLAKAGGPLAGSCLSFSEVHSDAHLTTSVHVGRHGHAPAGTWLPTLLRKHGMLSLPEGFGIDVVAEEPGATPVKQYAESLRKAMQAYGVGGTVSVNGLQHAEQLCDRARTSSARPLPARALLLGVPGHRGQVMAPGPSRLIEELQSAHVPFRLFSLENHEMDYSALDQMVSLVACSGGRAFGLELPWPEGVKNVACLGIDLGHPRDGRVSWLALSLVDSAGCHLRSWRRRQARDETPAPEALHAGLQWARSTMREAGVGTDGVLVLRDGRTMHHELFSDYEAVLGPQLTLVEVTKYNNPPLFLDGRSLSPAPPGTAGVVGDGVVTYMVTAPPAVKGQIPVPLKVQYARDNGGDRLGLGRKRIVELIAGMAYAPSLGFRPHSLPAPLYWADGIASIGPTNHQFSGQLHTES